MDEAVPAERWSTAPHAGECIAVRQTLGSAATAPTIVFLGGFHSSMAGTKARYLAGFAAARGWPAVRFDYRGHGESDGRFEDFSLQDWLEDALTVIDGTVGPLVLVGSSMGAWLAVHATSARPTRVVALLTLAAAPDFTERLLRPTLDADQHAALAAGGAVVLDNAHADDARESWTIRAQLLESGRALALLDGDRRIPLDMPVRAIHGLLDRDVPWSFSLELLGRLDAADSSLLLLPKGDHRLSDALSLARVAETLSALVERGDERP